MKNKPDQTEPTQPVRHDAWVDELLQKWDDAEKEWRKSAVGRGPSYEDGVAEGFRRCAVMLENRLYPRRSQGWWCETCKTHVSGRDVTEDERHDTRSGGCGSTVI